MAWQNLREDIEEMFSALEIRVVDERDEDGRPRMFGYHLHRHLNTTNVPTSAEDLERRRRKYRLERGEALRGRPRGAKGKAKPEREIALKLLAEGLSNREVAARLGVNKVTVQRWKKAA
jgi:DNA-binding NarL/FixJ family response regulator